MDCLMKTLNDYVKRYDILSPDESKNIIDLIEPGVWAPHEWYDPVEGSINNEKDFVVTNNNEACRLMDRKIRNVLHDYALSCMGEHPRDFAYSLVRFNKYSIGQSIREHIDHIHNLFSGNPKGIPILSLVGCLNDDYEGGQFTLCDEPIDIGVGQVIVFPSLFMYPHYVTPVTKGKRYSWVSWAV